MESRPPRAPSSACAAHPGAWQMTSVPPSRRPRRPHHRLLGAAPSPAGPPSSVPPSPPSSPPPNNTPSTPSPTSPPHRATAPPGAVTCPAMSRADRKRFATAEIEARLARRGPSSKRRDRRRHGRPRRLGRSPRPDRGSPPQGLLNQQTSYQSSGASRWRSASRHSRSPEIPRNFLSC